MLWTGISLSHRGSSGRRDEVRMTDGNQFSEQTDQVQPHQTAGTDPPTVYLVPDKSLHYTTGFLKEESHSFSPQKIIFCRDNVQSFQDSIQYVICSNILSHFCTKSNRWISDGIILRFIFAEKYLYNLNIDYNPHNWGQQIFFLDVETNRFFKNTVH